MSCLSTALREIRQKYASAKNDNSDKTPSTPTFGTIGSFVIGKHSENSPDWDADDWLADYEERAGIIEHDAKQSRTAAETMADNQCFRAWSAKHPYFEPPWRREAPTQEQFAGLAVASNR